MKKVYLKNIKRNSFLGLFSCNAVLEELAKRAAEVLVQMSNEELQLAQNVSPQACAKIIAVAYQNPTTSIFFKKI